MLLSEIPFDIEKKNKFPPIIKKNRNNESITENEWKLYEKIPFFLWYSPVKLPKYEF